MKKTDPRTNTGVVWRRYNGYRVRFHVWVFLTEFGPGPHQCEYCGKRINKYNRAKVSKVQLTVHHKDGNRSNNNKDNLMPLHLSCHRKIHEKDRAAIYEQASSITQKQWKRKGMRTKMTKAMKHGHGKGICKCQHHNM